MKTVTLLLLTLLITQYIQGQLLNQEVTLKNKQKILVGAITKEKLLETPYRTWFNTNFDGYTVNKSLAPELMVKLKGYHILVFLGTWCGDSKREIPKFLKILETVEFDMKMLKMVAVDNRAGHYKKSPTGEEWGLKILRVPTIIFLKNGREVNRVIESPNTTLEEDMLKIVSQQVYRPHKAMSYHLD